MRIHGLTCLCPLPFPPSPAAQAGDTAVARSHSNPKTCALAQHFACTCSALHDPLYTPCHTQGAIQANHPVPAHADIYYYEVLVLDGGLSGKIAVGFADKSFKLTRQPG